MNPLSHVDEKNHPCMVDVSDKLVTKRVAKAKCFVYVPSFILDLFHEGEIQSKKGPVFQTAIIAGHMAMKKTSDLIPFCHPLQIEGSGVEITIKNQRIEIYSWAKVTSKTGVEMEALMGAQIAGLTVYDMLKALSHKIVISDISLIEKTGGKSDFLEGPHE